MKAKYLLLLLLCSACAKERPALNPSHPLPQKVQQEDFHVFIEIPEDQDFRLLFNSLRYYRPDESYSKWIAVKPFSPNMVKQSHPLPNPSGFSVGYNNRIKEGYNTISIRGFSNLQEAEKYVELLDDFQYYDHQNTAFATDDKGHRALMRNWLLRDIRKASAQKQH